MWLPWSKTKSPTRIHDTSSSSSRQFSCSSFKDIVNLAADDPTTQSQSQSQPSIPQRNNNNKARTVFRRVRLAFFPQSQPYIPGAEKRVIVFLTSLRVVRATFENCRTARAILRALRVPVEERDLSMDSAFIAELRHLLGAANAQPPCVFVGGRYLGGAEDLRRLHEAGELGKLVEGLPASDAAAGSCSGCGGFGFVLCGACDGSHKVYYSDKLGFRSCLACNENGLVRCPSCSWS